MTQPTKDFSDKYFDAEVHEPGKYTSYEGERFYPAFGPMVEEIKKHVPGKKVLDIGCAKGFLVDVLRKEEYEAYGTDISDYAIKQGPESVRQYLHLCDLNTDPLPFADQFVDIIICMGTLEYVLNQIHALTEINRVLKPGGYILMTTLDHVSEDDQLRKYAKKEDYWERAFSELGYSGNKNLATKIISRYVKKIIEYDIAKVFNDNRRSMSFKTRIGKLIFNSIGRRPVINFLYKKQLRSGYLMLAFIKK